MNTEASSAPSRQESESLTSRFNAWLVRRMKDPGDYYLAYRVFGIVMLTKTTISAIIILAGGVTLQPGTGALKIVGVVLWVAATVLGTHLLLRRHTRSLRPLSVGILVAALVACLPIALTHDVFGAWLLFLIFPVLTASATLPPRMAWLTTGTMLLVYGPVVAVWGDGNRLGDWLTVAVWLSATTLVCSTLYSGGRVLASQLRSQAMRDSLTGLANRRAFDDFLAERIASIDRRPQLIALLLFDLDHFKAINDTSGHATGDTVLGRFGHLLAQGTRPDDMAARIGGEEFAVVMVGATLDDAAARADEIRRSVERASQRSWGTSVTISAGVALLSDGTHERGVELIAAADNALYRAKAGGRNRVCVAP